MAGCLGYMRRAFHRLWGLLVSPKVTVVLLLLVLALLLVGVWFPQEPADLAGDDLAQWWDQVREHYGDRLALYQRLGLLHLYRTPVFVVALSLLLLNTLACTIDRLGGLWRAATHRPAQALPPLAYERARWQAEGLSPAQARRVLRRRWWRVWDQATVKDGDGPSRRGDVDSKNRGLTPTRRPISEAGIHYFYAERFRWGPLGTVLTHLGLFLLALAALLHVTLGWREYLLLDPAPSRAIGMSAYAPMLHRSGWQVAKGDFEGVFRRGVFRGGRAEVFLLDGDRVLGYDWVAPTAPASIRGINFYLDSYGLVLQAEAFDQQDSQLAVVYPEEELVRFDEGTSEGAFEVPDLGWQVTVVPSSWARIGVREGPIQVRVDRPDRGETLFEGEIEGWTHLQLPGGRLWLYPDAFVVVEAVRDPGWGWFLAGGLALVVGSGATLLFPRRRLWARLTPSGLLQVRFGRRGPSARAAHVAALERALRRVRGGAP